MIAPLPLELCLCLLWTALLFISGMVCGYWLAEHNPPDDGDSSSGKSPAAEEPK